MIIFDNYNGNRPDTKIEYLNVLKSLDLFISYLWKSIYLLTFGSKGKISELEAEVA